MKVPAVILGTLAEQIEGQDPEPIDPAKVQLDPAGTYLITHDFDHQRPPLGLATVVRKDGRLIGELTFTSPLPFHPAYAVMGAVISQGIVHFKEVAIVGYPADRRHPPIPRVLDA